MYSTILILRSIIYGAVGKGANLQTLCDSLHIKPSDLHDTERKMEGVESISNLWESILTQTRDECIGLHIGAENNLSVMGLIGYVIQNCPTLKDAWDVLQRNQRLLSGWVSYDMQIRADDVHLVYSIDPLWAKASPHTAWQGAEIGMAGIINSLRILSGRSILPVSVELVRPKPSVACEHERIFQCPVKFSRESNRLIFRKEFLTIPILSFDKSLYANFSQLLHEKANALTESITFVEQVKRAVIRDFKGQVPPIDVIASHLNTSNRSFQRKLEVEGSSYRVLSEGIKKELTLALLKNPKYNTSEISKVLGYTEPTAFRLAFKRWMHETPVQWRKRNKIIAAEE